MSTLLEQLYGGGIYPAEKIVVRTPEYKELNQKISDEKTYFDSVLFSNDGKRFEDLGDMELQRSSAYAFENFVYGFRLGVGLILETLNAPPIDTKG